MLSFTEKLLLSCVKQQYKQTALYCAALYQHAEAVEILLSNGADPNKCSAVRTYTFTLLFQFSITHCLLFQWEYTALMSVSENGCIGIAELLLIQGANPDEQCGTVSVLLQFFYFVWHNLSNSFNAFRREAQR